MFDDEHDPAALVHDLDHGQTRSAPGAQTSPSRDGYRALPMGLLVATRDDDAAANPLVSPDMERIGLARPTAAIQLRSDSGTASSSHTFDR